MLTKRVMLIPLCVSNVLGGRRGSIGSYTIGEG